MDLIKIGKYIAGKRKKLGMTQKQLAEKLGMSDKSVSKWERGVCLPDVSLYTSLCETLGISINEFLAGEDIQKENIVQRSDETIIEVVTESKYKQKRLKRLIYALLPLSLAALLAAGVCLFLQNRPQNYIAPVERNSIEMKTAEMLSETNDAFIYKYKTTDDYTSLRLYVSEYQTGALIRKNPIWEIGYKDIGSPENGTILIVPSMKNSAFEIIESYTASPGAKKRISSRVAAVLRSKEPRILPSLLMIEVLLYLSQSGGIKRDCFAAFTL